MKLKWCVSFAITVLIAIGLWFNLAVAFWFYWVVAGLVLLALVVLISATKNPIHREAFKKHIKPPELLDFIVRHLFIGSALIHTESWNTLFVLGVQVVLMLIFVAQVKKDTGE